MTSSQKSAHVSKIIKPRDTFFWQILLRSITLPSFTSIANFFKFLEKGRNLPPSLIALKKAKPKYSSEEQTRKISRGVKQTSRTLFQNF